MEVPADAAHAFVGESEGERGCGEYFAGLEYIFCRLRINAGVEVGVAVVARVVHAQFVVAAPTEGSADNASTVLARLSVERNHHLGSVVVGVAHAVAIAYHLQSGKYGFAGGCRLSAPVAVHVYHIKVALRESQMA